MNASQLERIRALVDDELDDAGRAALLAEAEADLVKEAMG